MVIEGWQQTLGAGPLIGIALAAVALILVLVIKFRLHAFLTLILVSILTAVVTGIPIKEIPSVIAWGFNSTLGSVAILVGLGAMLGKLVENSGGAQVLADAMIRVFGEKRAPLALGVASLLLGFPMFFDAGLIVMLPIVFAVARRLNGPILLYAIPVAAAFSTMHVFVPPHPGAVAAAAYYNTNLGLLLLTGLIIALPTFYVSGYLWGKYCGTHYAFRLAESIFGEKDVREVKNPPSVKLVIGVLLLPMVLIFLNTGVDFATKAGSFGTYTAAEGLDGTLPVWAQLFTTLGTSPVALLISVLVAIPLLGFRNGEDGTALEKILDSSLPAICSVILITGAGGMFGGVLRTSGIGSAIADSLADTGIPVILAAYVIAVALRLAQGSATVALITAASLIADTVIGGDFSAMQVVAITLATAAGSVCCSHVNDSGFWLVGRLLGMDAKTTLKTWTVQQTIESVFAFVLASIVFVIF
ncbi:MAG: GntP family permease [Flaviflexus sp.]|nr:GntP family permease [Flaviflexus sp.]